MDRKDIGAYKGLALSSFKQKNYKQALTILGEAAKINDKDHEIWSKLGEVYFIKKDFKKAIDSFEQAYQLLPNLKNKYNLAGALLGAKKFDEAENMYENIVKEHPKHIEAKEGLADVYISKKSFKKAKINLQEIIERFPKYKNIKRVRNKIKELRIIIKNK